MMMEKGIDLQKALEILGERSKGEGDHHQHHHHHSHGDGNGNGIENPKRCVHNAHPAEAKHWGQTLDLLMDEDRVVKELGNEEAALKEQKVALDRERKQRQADLYQRMEGMTVQELVELVLTTQAERVAAYRSYDRYVQLLLMKQSKHKMSNLTYWYQTYNIKRTGGSSPNGQSQPLSRRVCRSDGLLCGPQRKYQSSSYIATTKVGRKVRDWSTDWSSTECRKG
jgi:hypothetical protein